MLRFCAIIYALAIAVVVFTNSGAETSANSQQLSDSDLVLSHLN